MKRVLVFAVLSLSRWSQEPWRRLPIRSRRQRKTLASASKSRPTGGSTKNPDKGAARAAVLNASAGNGRCVSFPPGFDRRQRAIQRISERFDRGEESGNTVGGASP